MSVNLLELLQEHLSSDVVANLAGLLGESTEKTTSAVSSALPALLAGLAEKSSDETSLSSLFNLIINDNHDGGVLSNLGALSRGGDEATSLIAGGTKLLSTLFGDKADGINGLIANISGISGKSSESLLGFLAPVVLGLVGKTLKLQHADTASGLAGLLGGQNDIIKNLIPAGLSGIFGTVSAPAAGTTESPLDKAMKLGDDSDEASITYSISEEMEIIEDKIEAVAEDTFNVAKESAAGIVESATRLGENIVDDTQDFAKSATAAFNETAEESGSKLLPWFMIAAALALLWAVLKSCSTEETAPETPVTQSPAPAEQAPASVETTPDNVVPPTSQETAQPTPAPAPVEAAKTETPPVPVESSDYVKDLPTGFHIQASKDGVEQKLVTFIESNEAISKDLWFNMAGIQFDTDKATIRPESDGQITNIAEIMKAFPKVKINIGGYTDNTGKPANNRKLSGNRALAVKKAIIKKGIAANRVSSEGYGSEHPVASNDTPEGRQQNRRIDVRVTAK